MSSWLDLAWRLRSQFRGFWAFVKVDKENKDEDKSTKPDNYWA